LAQTYSTLGNFEKAYKYQNKYDILHDSLEEKKRVNTMSDYEAFYELKDMEYELNKNKLAVIKKENKILQQERYLVISLVISISLFLIFVLLGYSYQIKRKTNRLLYSKNEELKQLNQIIAASLKEKEILLKEIHHRVKNNLQLVMSLLNIQAQDSQHTSIEDFLEKGQLRIVTMSLIHQNLYLSENFTNIDFQIYLESLVENIQHTFNGNNVTSVINTNGNTFNLDTAIPLGLIINEIVCNALKHAFPDNMKGQIQISIQKKEPDLFELQIGDNGIGIQQTKKSNSIGLELVSLLVLQLRGKMHKINKRGTNYSIEFKQSTSY
jgi:two-component sensor histidine kinase